MPNTTKVLEALSAYTGDADSLARFTEVVEKELGSDWPSSIYTLLPNLPKQLKDKLDHAANYFGATASWNEVQSYLNQEQPLNITELSERLPTLEYWLQFFGEPGVTALKQLQEKINTQQTTPPPQEEIENQLPTDEFEETNPQTDYSLPETDIIEEENMNAGEQYIPDDTQSFPEEYQEEFNPENNEADAFYDEEAYNEEPYEEQPYGETVYEEAPYDEQIYEETPYEEQNYENTEAYQDTYAEANSENIPYNEEYYEEQPYNAADNQAYENTLYDDEQEPLTYNDSEYTESYDRQEEQITDNISDASENYTDNFSDTNENYDDAYSEEYDANSYQNGPWDNSDYTTDAEQEQLAQETPVEEENWWHTPVYEPQKAESNEEFMARKTFHQLDFVNAVHSWINARCFQLGNIEIYAYKYYGFLVDAMEQTKKDIQEVLSSPAYYPAIENTRKDGLKILQNNLVSLEKDLKIAYDNAQSDVTPLIADDLNTNALRNALGMLDTSNKKEYLGPAPDGFEMVDDPYTQQEELPMEKVKKQKETIKKTSQNTQNSVQRKISFSFNKKNPSGTA